MGSWRPGNASLLRRSMEGTQHALTVHLSRLMAQAGSLDWHSHQQARHSPAHQSSPPTGEADNEHARKHSIVPCGDMCSEKESRGSRKGLTGWAGKASLGR